MAQGEVFGAARHIVLVGLPGVGKSTVGRAVAARLNRSFIDLDEQVERSFGKSVERIFAEDGEVAFRLAEAEMSRSAASMAPSVIAPGGGWVLNLAALAHLQDRSRIIYLRVTPDSAVRRMGRGISRRPLLRRSGDPYETMRALYQARRSVYEECSEMVVETGGVGRSAVIARVIELVQAAERNFTYNAPDRND